MRAGAYNIKFLLEGFDISNLVSKYSIRYPGTMPAIAQLNIARGKKFGKIKPSTLLHIFLQDPTYSQEWFLMFEGSLSSKNFIRSGAGSTVDVVFHSISKILDDSKYTKGGGSDGGLLDMFTSDILYVNLGLGAGEKMDVDITDAHLADLKKQKEEKNIDYVKEKDSAKKLEKLEEISELSKQIEEIEKGKKENPDANSIRKTVFVNPANSPTQFIAGTYWQQLKEEGKSYKDVIKLLLEGMTINVPYFKIIDESLKFTKQLVISDNPEIKEVMDLLGTFNFSHLERPNNLKTYRAILQDFLSYNILRMSEFGVPGYFGEKIARATIFPDLDYTAPPIFNVIYPDEYDNFELALDLYNEPTRGALTEAPIAMGAGDLKIVPTFISPSNALEIRPNKAGKDKTITYNLAFTEEEKYRGINPIELQNNVYEHAIARMFELNKDVTKIYNPGDTGGDKPLIDTNLQGMMRFVSDYAFAKARLSRRGMGYIEVEYFNPHWLCGFPGLIITPNFGPVLVNFDNIIFSGDASGAAKSAIGISKPRLISDTGEMVSMDMQPPRWYRESFRRDKIGAEIYKLFSNNDKPSSIIDYSPSAKNKTINFIESKGNYTKMIESAAIELFENYQKGEIISIEDRRRKLVSETDYFKYLGGKTYRTTHSLDPFAIAWYATKGKSFSGFLSGLRHPFVYERGKSVSEWLEVPEPPAVEGSVPVPSLGEEDKKILEEIYPNSMKKEDFDAKKEAAKSKKGGAVGVSSTPTTKVESTVTTNSEVYSGKVDSKRPAPGTWAFDKAEDSTVIDKGVPYRTPHHGRLATAFYFWSTNGSNESIFVNNIHRGVDIFHGGKDFNIVATAGNGTVSEVFKNNYFPPKDWHWKIYPDKKEKRKDKVGYGNVVIIYHQPETVANVSYIYATVYAHLESIHPSIVPGAKVDAGQVIGTMGNSGIPGATIHVHYEIWKMVKKDGEEIWCYENPMNYFKAATK